MSTKKWLVSAALAGVAFATTPANAAHTITCDNISNASSCVFGNDALDTGENIDEFEFTIAFAKTLTGALFTQFTTIDENVNFPQRGAWVEGGSLLTPALFSVTRGENPDFGSIGPILLGAGTYTVRVRSFAGPNGAFSGTLSLGAVPEPATWAFLILGFGLIGGAIRRSKASDQEGNFAYA